MKSLYLKFIAAALLISAVSVKSFSNEPPLIKRFVTQNGAGSKNGTSWSDAYDKTQLQTAIDEPGVNVVWVAAGIYKPTSGGDRTISFMMKNDVAIYGGFAGNENGLSERNISANETILSGDLLGNDNYINPEATLDDNSYHVFYHGAVSLITGRLNTFN